MQRAACRQHCRTALTLRRTRYSSSCVQPLDPHVQILLRNPELSPEDAENEARWIKVEARESIQRQGAMLLGLTAPNSEDVEALSVLECGRIMGFFARRAAGEPLQYVLGEHVAPCSINLTGRQCRLWTSQYHLPRPDTHTPPRDRTHRHSPRQRTRREHIGR
jgi:hypothetical protein